jgi:DNA-binding CsgD family transcriptional regulator
LGGAVGPAMRALIIKLWLRWKNRTFFRTGVCALQLDPVLLPVLRELAELYERPFDEVAGELLGFAIMQRKKAEENLRRWRALSPREREVAALVVMGYSNPEIAEKLFISRETVKTHVYTILRKCGLRRRQDLQSFLREWDFSAWDPKQDVGRPQTEADKPDSEG